jgi:hypothetical protein
VNFIDRFAELRPFAYHVTRAANLQNVARAQKLFPAADLIRRSAQLHLLRLRRSDPRPIAADGQTFVLQDQRPLIVANDELHSGWTGRDFVEFLLALTRADGWESSQATDKNGTAAATRHSFIVSPSVPIISQGAFVLHAAAGGCGDGCGFKRPPDPGG